MGFFKDFKDDFSKAVNELLPDADNLDESDDMVNTLDEETTNEDEEYVMKEWLEEFAGNESHDTVPNFNENTQEDILKDSNQKEKNNEIVEDKEKNMEENIDLELLDALNAEDEKNEDKADNNEKEVKVHAASVADDEVTVISKGTNISGNISSSGSLEVMGNVTGDVECLGKLTITGKVIGNTSAAEVIVNSERLEGSITSEGVVKIGLGTVVIGDILGTSAVIAGAVKGEIDINGPVVVDSSAIIKGNIKAKALQINNGAVIEGFCSLAYTDVNTDNIFE